MSLVDRANELEYVPEEQLIQMSQSPEGQYPQFLVLSEIQRRNQMRRMYKNQMAKMNQPTTTVAEESVMELAGQGAVPMMDSLSSLSSSEGGLRSMAPTPMKSGKKTEIEKDETELSEELRKLLAKDRRYAQQYKDYKSRERFFPPLVPENYIVSDDKYDRLKRSGAYMREGNLQDYRPFLALLGALSGESGPRYMPESKVKGLQAMVEATRKEKQMQQMGMQAGGSTALEQSFIPPMRNTMGVADTSGFLDSLRERYVNPDGTYNTAQMAKDGVSAGLVLSYLSPAGAIRGGLGLLGKGVMSLAKPFTAAGREGIKRSIGRQAAKINPKMVRDPKTGKFRSQAEIGGKAISSVAKPLGLTAGIGILQSPDEDTSITNQDDTGLTDAQKRAESSLQDLQKLLDKPTDTTTTEKQGFASDDFLTLAQLGGILGGATNLGEAAMGIGNLAGQIQKTRRTSKLEGLQGELLQAQADKYKADIANMEPQQIINEQNAISSLLKQVNEGAVQLSEQDKNNLIQQYMLLQDQLNTLRGVKGIKVAGGKNVAEGIPGASIG